MASGEELGRRLAEWVEKLIGIKPPDINLELPEWTDSWKHATVTVTSNPLDEPFVREFFRYNRTLDKIRTQWRDAAILLLVAIAVIPITRHYTVSGWWTAGAIAVTVLLVLMSLRTVITVFSLKKTIRDIDSIAKRTVTGLSELVSNEMAIRLTGANAVLEHPHWCMVSDAEMVPDMRAFFDMWNRAESLGGQRDMKTADTWIETVRLFVRADEQGYSAWNDADMPADRKKKLRRIMRTAETAKTMSGPEADNAMARMTEMIGETDHNSRFEVTNG